MNKFALLLAAGVLGLGMVCLRLVGELRSEREQVQALQLRAQALMQERRPAGPGEPAFANDQGTLEESADRAAGTVLAHSATRPDTAGRAVAMPGPPSHEERLRQMQASMQRQRELLRDPDYRDAVRAQQRMIFARNHPGLADELGLDDAQMDRFMSLIVDQQLRHMEDTAPPWSFASDTAALQDRARRMQERQQADEMEMAALLGPDTVQAWKEYQSTLGVRGQVDQMRTSFASKGEPLADSTVKSMLRTLADEQQRYLQEMQQEFGNAAHGIQPGASLDPVRSQELQIEGMARYQQRVRDALSPLLSPAQLRILAEENEQQLNMIKVQARMMRAQAEAAAREGGNPAGLTPFGPAYIGPALVQPGAPGAFISGALTSGATAERSNAPPPGN